MRRHRRAIPALLLALLLSLFTLPGPALAVAAEPEGTLENFVRVRRYEDQFDDLQPWFRDNVMYLYEIGLSDGDGSGRFGSADELTLADVATFAARIRYIYLFGSFDGLRAWDGYYGNWYTASVEYLKEQGLLSVEAPEDGRYDRVPATRALAARIWANLLPDGEYGDLNGPVVEAGLAAGTYITDVDPAADYAADVLRLYRAGIVTGTGDEAQYLPEDTITRREFSAMIARLVEPSFRVTINYWDLALHAPAEPEPPAWQPPAEQPPAQQPDSPAETVSPWPQTMPELIRGTTSFTPEHALKDEAAVKGNLEYMLQRDELSLTLEFSRRVSESELRSYCSAYLDCMSKYFFEQSCGLSILSEYTQYPDRTTLKLTFGAYGERGSEADRRNRDLREETMERALAVHDELWSSGTLTADMSQREVARVYYDWIANHCRYDDAGLRRNDMECHTALKLFDKGLAVCDGYTMAYNLLLEIEGIDCDTAHTADHIWTVAELDGTRWHIDTTWGDQGSWVDYDCFCMTEREAYARDGL